MKTQKILIGVVSAIFFLPLIALAGGGYEQARIYASSPTSLRVQGYVNKNNEVINFNIINGSVNDDTPNYCFQNAPSQQPDEVKFGHVNFSTTPEGYNQIIAWLNITNDGTSFGSVEVKSMEIWGKNANGKIFPVSDDLFCKKDYCTVANLVWGSMLQNKNDWDNDNKPYAWAEHCADGNTDLTTCDNKPVNPLIFQLKWNKPKNGLFTIPTVVFPTSKYSNQVFHPWSAVWDEEEPNSPRSNARSGVQYAVRVIAKINGAGRLQAGLDYWAQPGTKPFCKPWGRNSEICEGAVSNWQCASKGWISVIAGAPGIFQP